MRQIVVIHWGEGEGEGEGESTARFLDREVLIRRCGCGGDLERARALVTEADGQVDAIALDGIPTRLELGPARRPYRPAAALVAAAGKTPLVDGGGLRSGLERWGIILAERARPGLLGEKRVLMVPGLNHTGLAGALARRTPALRYADPEIFFGFPELPGVGWRGTLGSAAGLTLDRLAVAPLGTFTFPPDGERLLRASRSFAWADVLAGDVGAIRRHAPERLAGKTVVVECAGPEDVEELARRGVSVLITLMPPVEERDGDGGGEKGELGRFSAAVVEALLVALRPDPEAPLTEDTYLNLMADLSWTPAVRDLVPEHAGTHRFAFVVHPLDIGFIHKDPRYRWTRFFPDPLVEWMAAWMPPMVLSRIRGGRSPATGQRIEGILISLAATPRQMLHRPERFVYDQLHRAARLAERLGARIMGLGAFTSVAGDAGETVAHEANIAITSGNSLTVAATLEAAKQAVRAMGVEDLSRGRAMVIGATGSIGSVCARLLAQAIGDVVLVSIEPEKLIELKRTIERESPGARVVIATQAGDLLGSCDLVVTATSAFAQRILDISRAKPGAVICDVARPCDISPAEAELRPDVLVIESGEVVIPGEVDFGYDIGLPAGTAYACLAETALLAMEGRFESFTLGRTIDMERVKEIYRLYQKHGFRISGLRSFECFLSDEDLAAKRQLAERLRADPELLGRTRAEAAARLERLPATSKGVSTRRRLRPERWLGPTLLVAAGGLAWGALRGRRRPPGATGPALPEETAAKPIGSRTREQTPPFP